jgi:transposase-like protein
VHAVRTALKFVPYKDRRAVAAGLKEIYSSPTEEAALRKLDEFAGLWDEKYPLISKSWRTRWTELVPFLAYPKEIRRVLYTTHAIESLNYSIRKVTKNRSSFDYGIEETKNTTAIIIRLNFALINNYNSFYLKIF